MKIAICISGHLRNYKELTNNFKNFLRHLESFGKVDIFVATWDRENAPKSWSEMHGLSNLSRCKNQVLMEDVQDVYGSKNICIFNDNFYSSSFSPLNHEHISSKNYCWHSNGVYNKVIHSSKMYFLIHEANKLKKQEEFISGNVYDVVFRLRPDYEFIGEKYKSIDYSNLDDKYLYARKPHGTNICDQFAFGSSSIMDIYANTFLKYGGYIERGIFGDPEEFLHQQVQEHNIPIHLLNPNGEAFAFGCLRSEIFEGHAR